MMKNRGGDKSMDIRKMRKEDFEKVPGRERFDSKEPAFDSLVIIPMEDSLGRETWGRMDFVGCVGPEPVVRLSGASETLDLEGHGGHGEWMGPCDYRKMALPAWSIDCLPCGYLRIFCKGQIKAGGSLTSFEIFSKERRR
jgi:hypothetical protein